MNLPMFYRRLLFSVDERFEVLRLRLYLRVLALEYRLPPAVGSPVIGLSAVGSPVIGSPVGSPVGSPAVFLKGGAVEIEGLRAGLLTGGSLLLAGGAEGMERLSAGL